jgi:hypothetical protein
MLPEQLEQVGVVLHIERAFMSVNSAQTSHLKCIEQLTLQRCAVQGIDTCWKQQSAAGLKIRAQ